MTDINAEQVAAFLRRHPDFLSSHADLALALQPPLAAAGNTASLATYQVEVLRDKNRELQRRLKELLDTAQNNELLLHRVHLLSLRLLRARDLHEGVQQIAASLHEDFHTDLVRLVLIGMPSSSLQAPWLIEAEEADPRLLQFHEFLRHGQPLCGRLKPEKLAFLFAAQAGEVASGVLLPLGPVGLLAVGSQDPNRFHPGMGTLFLGLMAELMATALAVLSERSSA
jgi:hypothetical protein